MTDGKNIDCGSVVYVVADNGHVSAASLAEPFATRKEAEDEAFVVSGMAPERTYTVIEIEHTECRSIASAVLEIKRRLAHAEEAVAGSEKYPVYRDQQRARRDAYCDALDILSRHTEQESVTRVPSAQEHPPCIVCGERCPSQHEHTESNGGRTWATCSGCDPDLIADAERDGQNMDSQSKVRGQDGQG